MHSCGDLSTYQGYDGGVVNAKEPARGFDRAHILTNRDCVTAYAQSLLSNDRRRRTHFHTASTIRKDDGHDGRRGS